MFKKLLLVFACFIACTGFAFAQVDINKADQAALDGIKGIGPKMSQKILDERKKRGDFKDWKDVETRVKGIKEKSALRLSSAGLTVNGQSKNSATPAIAPAKTVVAKAEVKPAASATEKSVMVKQYRKPDASK